MTPEDRFDALSVALSTVEGVSLPAGGRRTGAPALRRDGRIVAMLDAGHLVVKLPRSRVDELVAAGQGTHFGTNGGPPMREWFVLAAASAMSWSGLTGEALEHARR